MHSPNSTNRSNAGNTRSRMWRLNLHRNNDAGGRSGANIPRGPRSQQNQNNQQRRQPNRGGGDNQLSHNMNQYGTEPINLNWLDQLSKMNSDDAVATLAQKKVEFVKLLHNVTTPDLLVVILQVLTNVCRANFTEIVTSVLSNACSANFLKTLEAYLTKLAFETPTEKMKNKLYHMDKNTFWSNLIEFFKKVIELLPHKARDELTGILETMEPICAAIERSQGYKIDEKVKKDALNMFQELENEIRKVKKKNEVRKTICTEPDFDDEPPEDFRSLSVIPTIDDLFDPKPFIRPCKIKDPYKSVEHYMDVQFRLLREDFVSPLRSGIQEYLQGPQKDRSDELLIYRRAKLMAREVAKDNIGMTVFFGKMKHINWARTKRFMFGGLLLLSSDNFKTILFFTVADHDEKQLQEGYVLIEPCEGTKVTREMYKVDYVMLESKIFFEPYFAVLTAMRHMTEQNFPMEKYLIEADTSTSLPKYLVPGQVLQYKDLSLPIGEDQKWPTAKEMALDETQYRAFKCALTEEFAVIQGPPGTGKTFIALEIVRTLLENKQHWERSGPIIVVCLTNHALDQFLEGILPYTKSIVRIGSQSKNEALKPHLLTERRKTVRSHERNSAYPVMCETKRELEMVLGSIAKANLFVKYLTTPNAIVPLSVLRKFCHDKALTEFGTDEELVRWLCNYNVNLIREVPLQRQEHSAEMMQEDNDEVDRNRHMDHELELNYEFKFNDLAKLVFPLEFIDENIAWLNQHIVEYKIGKLKNFQLDPTIIWQRDLDILNELRQSLQKKLAEHPLLTQQRYPPKNPRWRLYWTWIRFSHNKAMNKLTELERMYRHTNRKLKQAREYVDLAVLRQHRIVGLTTNGAATLHASLRALHAPIVLVEEAAEILESHVVCSMTKKCQHVILIGDHKQLRPKVSVYRLGTKYNLNISLFERMVNIRGNCTQLAHQHRMRPQFAKLITPSIYEKLYNHESVHDYPSVKGLEKNLFFLNHNNRENSRNNEDGWVNHHEAQFLVAFARHLVLQGYEGTEITILCMYVGQLFALKQEADRYAILKSVRITSVDNYQGEENKIILLSLVRNNGKGNIGFLKEENRVCVALSRAREGLYIMGNMDDLVVKNDIWPKIKATLEEENAIGDSFELRCQVHSEESIQVQNPSDFQKSPDGGCLKKCDADLPCGHSCTSICHILDRQHEKFECKQPCIKSCPNDHPCLLRCGQKCIPCRIKVERQLKCGHTVQMLCSADPDKLECYIEVEATLPDCNHVIKKPCHRQIEKCKCSFPCENRLPCGHACQLNCHVNQDPEHIEYKCLKECTKNNLNCLNDHPCKRRCHEKCIPCPVIVAKTRSCGHHLTQIQCAVDIEAEQCPKPCKRKMKCGHECGLKCSDVCRNCQVTVAKRSPCGHILKVKCCEEATRSKCNGKCREKLGCGHLCAAKCKELCTTTCKAMVHQSKPGLCGHIFAVPCHLTKTETESHALLKFCEQPCGATLACTHRCGGKCGKCKQGRIHVPCSEPCSNILICGHKCEVPCRAECQPCKKPCEVKCGHSKCNKQCGMPCAPCKEFCAYRCEHRRCKKRCSDLCAITPCNEPCKKVLKCQHPCVGFCGEPCPPLCRVCNKEELTELFLGDEDEPDARFIFLQDCRHCIESKGLLTWLAQSSNSIQMKTCPRCKTPIRKCLRIMNQIKKDLKDVVLVKRKVFGNPRELKQQQAQHVVTVQSMQQHEKTAEFRELWSLLQALLQSAIPMRNKKKQILSAQEVEALGIILDILRQILDTLEKIQIGTVKSYKFVKNQVIMLVESLPQRAQISNQEISDIMPELNRLNYMTEICVMESEACFEYGETSSADQKPYDLILQKLLSIEKFSSTIDKVIEQDLNTLKVSHHLNVAKKNERKMIVKAMGFTQGHWYKCPKGHIYAIGECGGAMEVSKCNECGAAIGGQSHRLTTGNALASEMDGARRSAWPGTGM